MRSSRDAAGTRDPPVDRVRRPTLRRRPAALGAQARSPSAESGRATPARSTSVPLANCPCATVRAPDPEQHQLAAVVELQREPVPPELPSSPGSSTRTRGPSSCRREPRIVSPSSADRPAGRHSRERVVVRGVAGRRSLARVPTLAVQHDRLAFAPAEVQSDPRSPSRRRRCLPSGSEGHGPVLRSTRGIRPRSRPPSRAPPD